MVNDEYRPRKQLYKRPMPEWLKNLVSVKDFPTTQVLLDSVYYPASIDDYYPIYAYSGFSHSFVYVDPHIRKQPEHQNLRGYSLVMSREILKEELYREIRKLVFQARIKQPNHGNVGDLRRTYDGAKIFLFGGGKKNPVYRETLLEGLDSQLEKNFDYGGVNNPAVLDLPDYKEIERPSPHVDSGRYAVAFGLTNNPLNLHKIILPDELSDITREAPPEDKRYGFDWND